MRTFERFVCLWFDLRVGAYLEESSGGIVEVGKGEGQKKEGDLGRMWTVSYAFSRSARRAG